MSDLINNWNKAKDNVLKAEQWQNLPNGRKYHNDKFDISIAHCDSLKLVRAGQQVCGGNNYWKSPEALNNEILGYIMDEWESIYPKVLKRLQEKEKKALLNCQEYITEMQGLIDGAQFEVR